MDNITYEAFENPSQFNDTSIEHCSDEWYSPTNGMDQYNMYSNTIEFSIAGSKKYFIPGRAKLEIRGILSKADSTLYADTDVIAPTNNMPFFLFQQADYELGDKILESYQHVGYATSMHKLLTTTQD